MSRCPLEDHQSIRNGPWHEPPCTYDPVAPWILRHKLDELGVLGALSKVFWSKNSIGFILVLDTKKDFIHQIFPHLQLSENLHPWFSSSSFLPGLQTLLWPGFSLNCCAKKGECAASTALCAGMSRDSASEQRTVESSFVCEVFKRHRVAQISITQRILRPKEFRYRIAKNFYGHDSKCQKCPFHSIAPPVIMHLNWWKRQVIHLRAWMYTSASTLLSNNFSRFNWRPGTDQGLVTYYVNQHQNAKSTTDLPRSLPWRRPDFPVPTQSVCREGN